MFNQTKCGEASLNLIAENRDLQGEFHGDDRSKDCSREY
jgi:hypothetical protein